MKIIISVVVVFFLIGCSDESSSSSAQQDIFKEPAVEVAPVVVADENAQVVQEESTEVVEVAQVEAVATKSGADLFKVCSSCHGANGEKKALNKSKIIQGWSEVQVSTALNGYKDGSYGGAMKGLMKSQVTKLSDEDIAVLAKHISGL